jgi:hypothetical protein
VTAIVTALYTLLTVLLWRATKRQAELTRDIFEATHRPHLSIEPRLLHPAHPGFIRLEMNLRNHGSIPAQVTDWAASFQQDGTVLGKTDAVLGGLCVFPGDGQDAPFLRVDGTVAAAVWDTEVHLHAKVVYRGDSAAVYSTAIKARFKITGQGPIPFRLEDVEHEVK